MEVMSVGTLTRSQKGKKEQSKGEKQQAKDVIPERDHEGEETGEMAEALRAGLATISNDIKELKQEIRSELTTFKDELKREMKEEIANLRQEIDRKLTENSSEIQAQKTNMDEAQVRISELEEWQTDANMTLLEVAERARRLQDKVTDLEGRSRRNNIRIFGVPEDTEGNSVSKYLEQLFTTELDLPEGIHLRIQRAHRALNQKPGPGAPPRSIIVNFLQFEVKEMVLKKAWQKKICVGEKQLYFDHDYATEIVQRRKAYMGIKKVLKEKGIRFQTPFDKIRIHWNNGVKTYGDAREAARDMEARGFTVNVPGGDSAHGTQERNGGGPEGQRQQTKERRQEVMRRVRQKLQAYQSK